MDLLSCEMIEILGLAKPLQVSPPESQRTRPTPTCQDVRRGRLLPWSDIETNSRIGQRASIPCKRGLWKLSQATAACEAHQALICHCDWYLAIDEGLRK